MNPQKFKDIETLIDFLNSNNIKHIDRIDQWLPVLRVSYSQVVAYCWEKTQRKIEQFTAEPRLYIDYQLRQSGSTHAELEHLEFVG